MIGQDDSNSVRISRSGNSSGLVKQVIIVAYLLSGTRVADSSKIYCVNLPDKELDKFEKQMPPIKANSAVKFPSSVCSGVVDQVMYGLKPSSDEDDVKCLTGLKNAFVDWAVQEGLNFASYPQQNDIFNVFGDESKRNVFCDKYVDLSNVEETLKKGFLV